MTDQRWLFISPSGSDVPRPPRLHKPKFLPAPWDLLTEPDGDDRSENEQKPGDRLTLHWGPQASPSADEQVRVPWSVGSGARRPGSGCQRSARLLP